MKNDNIHVTRLSELAFHLDNGDLYSNWSHAQCLLLVRNGTEIYTFRSLLFELIDVFADDFILNLQTQQVESTSHQPLIDALGDFFGLDVSEVIHLFGIDMQNRDRFGGSMLRHDCEAINVAENIFEILRQNGWKNPHLKS
jgi:hypothetical protein